jgi:hypothetical protein
MARQAQAEIGVLGHVERIPSADRVERRPAEMRPYVSTAPQYVVL